MRRPLGDEGLQTFQRVAALHQFIEIEALDGGELRPHAGGIVEARRLECEALPIHASAYGHDDMAADFVTKAKRQRVIGAHAVIVIAEVGVADAASGDFDYRFARRGLRLELR